MLNQKKLDTKVLDMMPKPVRATRDNISGTNSFAYTGLSITIKAGSFYCFTAKANYTNQDPRGVAIATSSVSLATYAYRRAYTESSSAVTTSGYVSEDTTLYLWAKWTNNGTNSIQINGFVMGDFTVSGAS